MNGCMNVSKMEGLESRRWLSQRCRGLGPRTSQQLPYPDVFPLAGSSVLSRNLGILFDFRFTVKYDAQCYISNYIDMFQTQFMLQGLLSAYHHHTKQTNSSILKLKIEFSLSSRNHTFSLIYNLLQAAAKKNKIDLCLLKKLSG